MIFTTKNKNDFVPTCKSIMLEKYQPVCAGFDIETTTIEHRAYMYHWQLSINDDLFVGRTWEEFKEIYFFLVDIFNTNQQRLLIWVHNLSFEWQFIKHRFQWMKDKFNRNCVFALDKRKICYCVTKENVEFRDSLVFTGMSLRKLADTFCTTQKMVGDLDYKVLRNSKTQLTDKELQYCYNDVIILSEFAEFTFRRFGDDIPLTKTGIVRNKLKSNFKSLDKEIKQKHRNFISRCFPSESQYRVWFRWIYRGGWVHANFEIVDQIIEDLMDSYDFKSSYPDECFEKFVNKFIPCKAALSSIEFVLNDIENYGFYLKVKIKNLIRKTCHSIFSLHKTKMNPGTSYSTDNGRITYCEECTLFLTEWDYLDLCNFYVWDEIEYEEMLYSKKEYLPQFILDLIYDYFIRKETSKGIDRVLSKADLNSIYGMMVTSIIQNDIEYNENTGIFDDGEARTFDKLIYSQILLPQWGIQISAAARHKLLQIVYDITMESEGTSDVYYSDTDSAKLANAEKHKHIIDEYNHKKKERNEKIRELFGYDLKELGFFTYECTMNKFKTLGCKRYIYDVEGETHCVIAGMPKHALDQFIECPKFNIYKYFSNNLRLPPVVSQKTTSAYNDNPHSDIVLGEKMSEYSSLAIFDIPFTMSMEEEYFILVKQKANKVKLFRERG